MSRHVFVVVLVGLAAFASGIASAWLVGKRITDRAMDDFASSLTWEPEGRVRVSVVTLKLLQRGEVDKAIEFNCQTARSALPLLGHADRIPARKESMDRLAADAERVFAGLEQAGKCGPR